MEARDHIHKVTQSRKCALE
uniref:Uncharacterized protein n=1 Tax=Anguilla anguilla TaxID=7936 RepID=A0A0E9PBB2_ANGAN